MKKLLVFFTVLFAAAAVFAKPVRKNAMAVVKVSATQACAKLAKKNASEDSLGRFVEAIADGLPADFASTGVVKVVSRSAIDSVLKEQNFGESGNVDKSTASQAGKLLGARYIVTVVVRDFQDFKDKAHFATLAQSDELRKVRVNVAANVIDTKTGEIVHGGTLAIEGSDRSMKHEASVQSGGEMTDAVVVMLADTVNKTLARNIVNHLFPPKITSIKNGVASINRGEGAGVEVGDEFEVYAAGGKVVDSDSGKNLGDVEETKGRIKVISVSAKSAKAKIVENGGVKKGQLVRPLKKGAAKQRVVEI